MNTLNKVMDRCDDGGMTEVQVDKMDDVVARHRDDVNTLTRLLGSFSPQVVLVPVGLHSLRDLGAEGNPDGHSAEDDRLLQAIKSGALAYLSRNASDEGLACTIRGVREGVWPVNEGLPNRAKVAGQAWRQLQDISLADRLTETPTTSLTRRETQTLKYVAEGYSNKQIARALYVSEQTVKNHVSSVQRKLGANNRAHAVVMALRQGSINLVEAVPQVEAAVA